MEEEGEEEDEERVSDVVMSGDEKLNFGPI